MKKRILSFLCVFCLICTMLPTVAAAWSAPTLSVEASLEGSQIKTTVKLGPHDIGAINFTLNYDSSKLTLSEAKGQNFLNGALIGTTTPGKITPVWYNVAGTNSSTEIPILTATFDVIAGQSGNVDFTIDTISITDKSGDNEVTSPGPGSNLATSITIPKAPISDVSAITATVDAPVKGTALATTVDLGGATAYTGTVEWFEGTGTSGSSASGPAAAGQIYTAKITLTAKPGESFANSLDGTTTGDGYQIKRTSDTVLELTKTFPATADKDPASITTPPAATTLTYNGSAQNLVTAGSGVTGGTLKYRLGESGLWSTDIPKATNAGDYTVYYMVEGDADHSNSTPVKITVTIGKKSITPTVTVTGSYTYNDGNPITPNFTVEDSGTGLAETDYTATVTNNINAGTGTITVKEAANGNYTFAQVQQNFTIAKKAHSNETASGSARYGAEGTVDLRSYIVPGGTATYASKTDSDSVLDGVPSLNGSVLKFKFVDDVTKVGKSATATINVTSANYTNYAITVTLNVTDKVTPTVTAPTAKALTYNGAEQVLINAGSTTGGELQYSLTSGSGYSTGLPKAKDAVSYNVYYKVVGDAEYADVAENYITVTIDKKAATVAPKSFTITKGSAIPTFGLIYTGLVSGDTLTPNATPTFTCFESDGTTAVSTSTPAGTYTITWTNTVITFTGADNYDLTNTATGTLTINNPTGGGGGGGGGVTTYAITVEDAKNGTITVSPKSASKGSTVTITVKPDKGYELDTLKVLDSKNQTIKLTEKDGKFTFTMPAGKVTVKGSFAKEAPEVPEQIFGDVPVDAYYYEAVKWAADKGITGGVGGNLFAPDQPCTRAQIVTFLWRAAGSPAPKSMNSFADVPADAYYAKAVAWAVENGITSGTGDGKFSPDAACTRAQCVTFLYRTVGSPAVSGSPAFSDVASDAYYAKAVKWAQANGITTGIGGGLFGSDGSCTRAQIVTFLYRYMEK